MTHLLVFKRWKIPLLILVPLLISLACATLTVGPADNSQAPQTAATAQVDVAFGSGPFTLVDTRAGLAELSSYKATLALSFDGTRDGQPSQWSKTYVMLTAKEPAERQLTIEKSGDISDVAAVLFAERDGAAYERRGEQACNANAIEQGNSLSNRLEPAGFLNGVIGADEVGAESVNDAAASHYTFNERAFGQLDIAQSTGEMWVASDGGYIVKYVVTTKGDASYFGEGIEGTLTWDYELTDVNAPATFALPADCPAGMVDAPQLPDASNILNMPSILSYDTASSLADAATFYQNQIPGLGWKLSGEPAITETTTQMEFTKENQTMTVIIVGDTGTNVEILLENVQE